MISVVVNSRNEADKLDRCLASVQGWCQEIVVIDMESADTTQDVAKKYNAKIFTHQPASYIEPVRAFAVSKASNKWIMLLDPDETVPVNLKKKLSEIAESGDFQGVKIARLNIIFGKKIKHSNFWPDYQMRFFQKDKITFSEVIHSAPKIEGKVEVLDRKEDLALHHYSYKNVKEYWQRMQRYSSIEAQNMYKQGKRFSFIRLFYQSTYDFLRRYIRHLGFLDGWIGLELSLLQFYYYILVEIKLLQLQK